jgi:WD40 repeat protein
MSKDKVYLYDLGGMTFVHRLNLDHHLGRVQLAANISADRPLLIYSNSADHGTLKVFDIEERKVRNSILCHESQILCFTCDLDGYYAVTCSTNGETIRLWNLDQGTKLSSFVIF